MVTYRLPKDKAIYLGHHRAKAVDKSNQSGLRVVEYSVTFGVRETKIIQEPDIDKY